jgi:integrase
VAAADVPPFVYRRGHALAQARPRVQALLGLRNRALLLVGFGGAFRRSELVGLDAADVRFVREGLVLTLRRSKTDQEAAGELKAIPYGERLESCPVRALQAWLEAAGITSGALFRPVTCWGRVAERQLSDQVVALVVKQRAVALGLDPRAYAGHSLRAGLATAAARAGVEERDIMRQTGHRSERMVRKYIREGQLFRNNASGRVGL